MALDLSIGLTLSVQSAPHDNRGEKIVWARETGAQTDNQLIHQKAMVGLQQPNPTKKTTTLPELKGGARGDDRKNGGTFYKGDNDKSFSSGAEPSF